MRGLITAGVVREAMTTDPPGDGIRAMGLAFAKY
jgi:hypothetical protein